MDEIYLAAVERGDLNTAQRMVDEAAAAAGYNIRAAHATNAAMFHGFRTTGFSAHFGTPKAAADRERDMRKFSREVVGRPEGDWRTLNVYLRVHSPLEMPDLAAVYYNQSTGSSEIIDTDTPAKEIQELIEADYWPITWEGEDAVWGFLYDGHEVEIDEAFWDAQYSDSELKALLKEEYDYDGIVYENIIEDPGSESYIIFDADQVKLADPITYDEEGNVIPLSQRFNVESAYMRNPPPRRAKYRDVNEDYGRVLQGVLPLDKFKQRYGLATLPKFPLPPDFGVQDAGYDCWAHVQAASFAVFGKGPAPGGGHDPEEGEVISWDEAVAGDFVHYSHSGHWAIVVDPDKKIVESCWGRGGRVFQHPYNVSVYDHEGIVLYRHPARRRHRDRWRR